MSATDSAPYLAILLADALLVAAPGSLAYVQLAIGIRELLRPMRTHATGLPRTHRNSVVPSGRLLSFFLLHIYSNEIADVDGDCDHHRVFYSRQHTFGRTKNMAKLPAGDGTKRLIT